MSRRSPREPARAPRRAPRRAQGADTRAVILEAVSRVVTKVGVEGASVRAIATAAGVGPGSIYQFFPTREALLAAWEEALLAKKGETLVAAVGERLAAQAPAEDVIAVATRVGLQVFGELGPLYRDEDARGPISRHSARVELGRKVEAFLAAALEHGHERHRILPVRSDLAARLVVRIIVFLGYDLARSDLGAEDRRAYEDEAVALVVRYLLRDPKLERGDAVGHRGPQNPGP